jgi:Ca2+-binding RTX toxin-like protein
MIRRDAALLSGLLLIAPLVVAASPAQAEAKPRCAGHRATIVGTAGAEVLYGTAHDDVIYAGGGNDSVFAGAGNDLVCGGAGADRLNGGLGNDRLHGGLDGISPDGEGGTTRTGDVLRGGPGNDVLAPGHDSRTATDINYDSILWDAAPGPVTIDATNGTARGEGLDRFDSIDTWLVGSDHNDTLRGSGRRDLLSGERGSDTIDGRGGDDFIFGDASTPGGKSSADVINGGYGADEIYTETGTDTVRGGPGPDILGDFTGKPDTLLGGRGDDQIIANIAAPGTRDQVLAGGPGYDELDLFSNTVNPTADPATGNWDMRTGDLTFAAGQPISITASSFAEADLSTFGATWSVTGTNGPDSVSIGSTNGGEFDGLGGNDTFLGSASDDTFNGGPGDADHSLAMGVGIDTCISVEIIDGDDCEIVTI